MGRDKVDVKTRLFNFDFDKETAKMNKPTIERSDGTKFWYINGKCHREDGPASEYSNGTKYWYINGYLHREDGPAAEYSDGSVEYYLNDLLYSKKDFDKEIRKMKKANKVNKQKEDKFYYSDGTTSSERDFDKVLHREDGPAVERSDGTKFWCINDKFHRADGPAIEYSNGDKNWYINGKLHREDGPAVKRSNGDVSYYLSGIFYSKENFDKEIAQMKKPKKDRLDNLNHPYDQIVKSTKDVLPVFKKESTMKEKVIQNFKSDSKKAIVRSGANKLTKTAKSAIVMASSKLSSEQAELVQKMVSSEKGEAGLRLALGYLLTYLPLGSLGDNPKVQLIAEEFRISGQTIVQDEVIEKLSSIFIPMIQSVVESMPEIEVNVTKKQPKAKTRVAVKSNKTNVHADTEVEVDESDEEVESKQKNRIMNLCK